MSFNLFLQKNPLRNTKNNANNSMYAYPASQIAINTAVVKQNISHFKHSYQTQNVKYFVGRETQFYKPNFPPN